MVSTEASAKAAAKQLQEQEILRDLEQGRKDKKKDDDIIKEISKTYKVTAKKIKGIDQNAKASDFEVRVVKFMKKMGFEDVRGTTVKTHRGIREFTFLKMDSGRDNIQVDAVGRIGKTIFLVECKTTENENGNYSGLEQEIHRHERRLKLFLKALNDNKPTKRNTEVFSTTDWDKVEDVYGVFAFENVKNHQEGMPFRVLERYDFKIWDDDFREYFHDLEGKIGKYAIYDMLGDMKIDNDDPVPVSTWALKTEIRMPDTGKKATVFQFLIDPRKLLKIATVARRERPGELYYQRSLIASKLRSIANFLSEGNLSPNNIVIGFDKDIWNTMGADGGFVPIDIKKCAKHRGIQLLKEEKAALRANPNLMQVEYGTLTFPRPYRSCWVIDGQHRLYGLARTTKRKNRTLEIGELRLPIIGFANIEHESMADMFLQINTNQKPLDANLKYDLFGDYRPDSKKGVASRIAKDLNQSGSLRDKIYYPSLGIGTADKKNRIGIAAFCEGILDSKMTTNKLSVDDQGNIRPNPLARKDKPSKGTKELTAWNNAVIKSVTRQIDIFYDAFEEKFNVDNSFKEASAFQYHRQTSKVILPFLSEVLAHAKSKANKRKLKKYLTGLESFMNANETAATRKSRTDAASRRTLAGKVTAQMCASVKESGQRGLHNFALARIGKIGKDWEELFKKFGDLFAQHLPDWEDDLTAHLKNKLKVKMGKEGKVDGEEHKVIDTHDIKRVLRDGPNAEDNMDTIIAIFRKTPSHSGMSKGDAILVLKDSIDDLHAEFCGLEIIQPIPGALATANIGKRASLIDTLSQIDLEDEEEEAEEN